MRVAYADPPYPGCAHYYGEREVDPAALVRRLESEFPDGWALSTHTNALRLFLLLCPPTTRVCAWVKGWASFKPGVHPAYAWEPVLISGGRKPPRTSDTVRDWILCHATTQQGFIGAKPERVSFWIFALLGLAPEDEIVDLYPGSGAVTRAWGTFQAQGRLFARRAP